MNTATISDRLGTTGVRQRLYSEPTLVEECQDLDYYCVWDTDCCPGLICEYGGCWFAG